MTEQISFRVHSKSEEGHFYTVDVTADGEHVRCNCRGFSYGYCSHIDAVLFAEETNMVLDEDREQAAAAVCLVRGLVIRPEHWAASWTKDYSWRGIDATGNRRMANRRTSALPLVCFTGRMPDSRAELLETAKSANWDVTDEPSPFTDVLVAADPNGKSAKLRKARENGTVIMTLEDWKHTIFTGEIPPDP